MPNVLPQTKDEKHKNMINGFIGRFDPSKYKIFETEYKFNYYGDRGYIDLLVVDEINDSGFSRWVNIYEFKTQILDVGDTIRQVKNYAKNIRREFKNDRIECNIVMYDTVHNLEHLYENIEYYYTALYNNCNNNTIEFGINYGFYFIDDDCILTKHVNFIMHPLHWFKNSLHDTIFGIKQTKSNNYKEYCCLIVECRDYMMKDGIKNEYYMPTNTETIGYYKNVVSIEQSNT